MGGLVSTMYIRRTPEVFEQETIQHKSGLVIHIQFGTLTQFWTATVGSIPSSILDKCSWNLYDPVVGAVHVPGENCIRIKPLQAGLQRWQILAAAYSVCNSLAVAPVVPTVADSVTGIINAFTAAPTPLSALKLYIEAIVELQRRYPTQATNALAHIPLYDEVLKGVVSTLVSYFTFTGPWHEENPSALTKSLVVLLDKCVSEEDKQTGFSRRGASFSGASDEMSLKDAADVFMKELVGLLLRSDFFASTYHLFGYVKKGPGATSSGTAEFSASSGVGGAAGTRTSPPPPLPPFCFASRSGAGVGAGCTGTGGDGDGCKDTGGGVGGVGGGGGGDTDTPTPEPTTTTTPTPASTNFSDFQPPTSSTETNPAPVTVTSTVSGDEDGDDSAFVAYDVPQPAEMVSPLQDTDTSEEDGGHRFPSPSAFLAPQSSSLLDAVKLSLKNSGGAAPLFLTGAPYVMRVGSSAPTETEDSGSGDAIRDLHGTADILRPDYSCDA
jgi:hypothetical protein